MKKPVDQQASWSGATQPRPVPALQRAQGRARIGLCCDDGQVTRLADLFQQGCLKVRLPRPQTPRMLDAVVINTSGGLTGGDALAIEVDAAKGALVTVTTPACERIYRSSGGDALVHQCLRVGCGARLDWLPQETILFDSCRLRRRLDVRLEQDAEITLAEGLLFGRAAMGEALGSGLVSDFWTIRRDGQLLFADAVHLSEPLAATMACPSTLHAGLAMATILHVGAGIEAKRDTLRSVLGERKEARAGVSVVGGVLVVRIVAWSGAALRALLVSALGPLRGGCALPRNWFC